MFGQHPAECLLATHSVWVSSKQLLGCSSHSLKRPSLQHLLLGSLSGRLLAALDHFIVPSQLERRGQRAGGRGTGGYSVWFGDNVIGSCEQRQHRSGVNALEPRGGCLSDSRVVCVRVFCWSVKHNTNL